MSSSERVEMHAVRRREVPPLGIVSTADGVRAGITRCVVTSGARTARSVPRTRRRADVAPVGSHPIACLPMLGDAEADFPGTHEVVQPVLQQILRAGTPLARGGPAGTTKCADR